jgi:hypothetical protein
LGNADAISPRRSSVEAIIRTAGDVDLYGVGLAFLIERDLKRRHARLGHEPVHQLLIGVLGKFITKHPIDRLA